MKTRRWVSVGFLVALCGLTVAESPAAEKFVSRANAAPRKVVVASTVIHLEGTLAERLQLAEHWLDTAAHEAIARYDGRGLDLAIFPEFSLQRSNGPTADEQAVAIAGEVQERIGGKARELHTWIVMPMTLREENSAADGAPRFSNAAVLFDREGQVAGIFRKVHPIADDRGVFEGGVTPGDDYPVFDCDFGKLGILICWDMSYEEAWDALAARGAEIVALPTASPQNVQPSAQARRHHYYVVNSAPRDNTTLFDPIGRVVDQVTVAPGVLVQRIDLSYAILHWSETLHEGRAFTEKFGTKAGYSYSEREDTGIFWSNDPKLTVGAMVRELGLREMEDTIARQEAARVNARGK